MHYLSPVGWWIIFDTFGQLLFRLIDRCQSNFGGDAILRLLAEKGRWATMAYLIRGLVVPDPVVAGCSDKLIQHTLAQNRVFTNPSAEQRVQIERALNDCLGLINDELVNMLSSYLSSYGFEFPSR